MHVSFFPWWYMYIISFILHLLPEYYIVSKAVVYVRPSALRRWRLREFTACDRLSWTSSSAQDCLAIRHENGVHEPQNPLSQWLLLAAKNGGKLTFAAVRGKENVACLGDLYLFFFNLSHAGMPSRACTTAFSPHPLSCICVCVLALAENDYFAIFCVQINSFPSNVSRETWNILCILANHVPRFCSKVGR